MLAPVVVVADTVVVVDIAVVVTAVKRRDGSA